MYTPVVIDAEIVDGAVSGTDKKAVRQRGWVSMGSEVEIEMEMVRPTREKIHVELSKKRRDFGASANFGDRDANDGFLECRPYRDPNFEVYRMEIQASTQVFKILIVIGNSTNCFQLFSDKVESIFKFFTSI